MKIVITVYMSAEDRHKKVNQVSTTTVKSIPQLEQVLQQYTTGEFLAFQAEDGTYLRSEADARYYAMSTTCFEIQQFVAQAGTYVPSSLIARQMELPDKTVEILLNRLQNSGELKCEPGIGWIFPLILRNNMEVKSKTK